MALQTGTTAPNFTLPSTNGTDFVLANNLGKPLVLFFYPKDFTPGCTAEACDFRDNMSVFSDLEVLVIGISRDTIATHNKFRAEHKLPYHLLADVSGKVSALYDAKIPVLGLSKRITYLVNAEGKIEAAFSDMFDAKAHIKNMLKALK
jgi:peroxiredoxin Q/BCP